MCVNKKYREKVIQMAKYDLKVREELLSAGKLTKGYNLEMKAVHDENKDILEKLINEIGFPTISLVGQEGHEAAWLIIQHSIAHPEFMKNMYEVMTALAEEEVSQRSLVYLEDRINYYERKPQRYGTQFDWSLDGKFEPWKIEDIEIVNELRKEKGLRSIEETKAEFDKYVYRNGVPSKEEIIKMRNEQENWLKETGWL